MQSSWQKLWKWTKCWYRSSECNSSRFESMHTTIIQTARITPHSPPNPSPASRTTPLRRKGPKPSQKCCSATANWCLWSESTCSLHILCIITCGIKSKMIFGACVDSVYGRIQSEREEPSGLRKRWRQTGLSPNWCNLKFTYSSPVLILNTYTVLNCTLLPVELE